MHDNNRRTQLWILNCKLSHDVVVDLARPERFKMKGESLHFHDKIILQIGLMRTLTLRWVTGMTS